MAAKAPEIVYLLADGGVPFYLSQKGASIHARSVVRALEREGCAVSVFAFRKGERAKGQPGFNVREARRSRLTQWFHKRFLVERLDLTLMSRAVLGIVALGFAFGAVGAFLAKTLVRWPWPLPIVGALLGCGVSGVVWLHKREMRRREGLKESGPKTVLRPVPNSLTALAILLWNIDLARSVLRRTRGGRPDLLYARHAWLAFAYARLKRRMGVPLVLEVNAVLTHEKRARGEMAFARLTRAIEKRSFEAADLILPVTAELREQVLAFGVDPAKVIVTPNAVDLERFVPRPAGKARGERFVIGSVQSFKAYHGTEMLLRTAAMLRDRIPEMRLVLVGKGQELKRCRQIAAQLGLGDVVEFTGMANHEEIPEMMAQFDVAVAPYVGEQNLYGCPMKLYEYMAVKAPIVASAWGDIPNILEHGKTALLHAPEDCEGLAAQIVRLYEEPELGERLAEAAYGIVGSWTWGHVARRILDWRAVQL